jgi:hypothetical protein
MEFTNQTSSFKQKHEFEWTELTEYSRNALKKRKLKSYEFLLPPVSHQFEI